MLIIERNKIADLGALVNQPRPMPRA